jgi:hypothetical protein
MLITFLVACFISKSILFTRSGLGFGFMTAKNSWDLDVKVSLLIVRLIGEFYVANVFYCQCLVKKNALTPSIFSDAS